jgi:aspartate racemase
MGPLASAEFMVKLVHATPALVDQDHYPMTLDSTPQIPDRPSALEGRGPDPLPAIVEVVRRLERSGCAVIAMPCNTVHHWFDSIQAATILPVLHIADAVAQALRDEVPNAARIGILGGTVTSQMGIFSKRLGTEWEWIYATDEELTTLVLPAIAAVKAGNLKMGRELFLLASTRLASRGIDALVYACTEISVVLGSSDVSVPVVDSMDALAKHTIRHLEALPPRASAMAAIPADARSHLPGVQAHEQ